MTKRTRMQVLAVTLVVSLVALGCAGTPGAPPPPPTADTSEATTLLPIETWSDDVSLRQRVEIRWGRSDAESARFEAVLEKRAGMLTLVGLGPMSRPGLVLRATDDGLEVTNRTGLTLPFDPVHILADVQRVFYPWAGVAVAHVELEETRQRGRLVERHFRRTNAPTAAPIRVEFGDAWYAVPHVPKRARVDNGWFGYSIVVETFAATKL